MCLSALYPKIKPMIAPAPPPATAPDKDPTQAKDERAAMARRRAASMYSKQNNRGLMSAPTVGTKTLLGQ